MTLSRKTPLKRTAFKRAERKEADAVAKLRKRKCAVCRELFEPRSMTHKACKPECAEVVAAIQKKKEAERRAKAERAADKERREKNMKHGEWVAKAQAAFNGFIRERDRDQPCICCGSFDASDALTGGGWDAGHYISRGHAAHLRFDERNVHKQRKGCNRPGGTTRAKYRVGLIERIGLPAVLELEALEYVIDTPKQTVDFLREIRDTYRAKLKALKGKA